MRSLLQCLLCWLCALSVGSQLAACEKARKLASERGLGLSPAKKPAAAERAAKPKGWRPAKRDAGGSWRALSSFMPDNIEGFRARMGRDGRDIDVGGAQPLLTVRRSYANKDGVILDIELIDSSASPRLRELFLRARELARDNERAVFRALKVQGQRAFSQWLEASKSTRTSVLIGERFLINVDVKPVTSPALGIAVAQKLDFSKLLELGTSPVAPKAVLDAGAAAAPDAGGVTPPTAAADAPAAEAEATGAEE